MKMITVADNEKGMIVVKDRGFLYANWAVKKGNKDFRPIAEHKVEKYCNDLITNGWVLHLSFFGLFIFITPERYAQYKAEAQS